MIHKLKCVYHPPLLPENGGIGMNIRNIIALTIIIFIGLSVGCRHSVEKAVAPASQTAADVAAAYGIDGFSKIDTIRFAFNVKVDDRQIQRKWSWRPEDDSVLFAGNLPDGSIAEYAYMRQDLGQSGTGISEKVDRWFINDQYWLLFPLHLLWDSGLQLTLDNEQPLPIPPGTARRLTATYPKGIGYTPGDSYELYLDENNMIQQWVYRRGAAAAPGRKATWENHVKAGPLVMSLEHNNEDGRIKIWFSDVAVRLKGEDKWITPEPLK